MRGLTNKIIVISGGCGDLGTATAIRLKEEGAKVVLLDVLEPAVAQPRLELSGAVAYYRCDQSDRAAVETTLAQIAERFGRLDVVIANAAMVSRALFPDITPEDWENNLRINLSGYFHIAQIATRLMLKQPLDATRVRGKILFTSSWTAQRPLPGNMPYVVTKAASEAMVVAMAQELASHGIRVNAIAPGLVYAGLTRMLCDKTPELKDELLSMVPLGELGTAEQVADAYAFLCSSDSDYMTGQTMVVDGGCSVIKRELPV